MKTLTAVCILTLLAVPARVRAGHELPYYPSFYPHEIRLEAGGPPPPRHAPRAGRVPPPPRPDPFCGAAPPGTAPGGPRGGGGRPSPLRGGPPLPPPPGPGA